MLPYLQPYAPLSHTPIPAVYSEGSTVAAKVKAFGHYFKSHLAEYNLVSLLTLSPLVLSSSSMSKREFINTLYTLFYFLVLWVHMGAIGCKRLKIGQLSIETCLATFIANRIKLF